MSSKLFKVKIGEPIGSVEINDAPHAVRAPCVGNYARFLKLQKTFAAGESAAPEDQQKAIVEMIAIAIPTIAPDEIAAMDLDSANDLAVFVSEKIKERSEAKKKADSSDPT